MATVGDEHDLSPQGHRPTLREWAKCVVLIVLVAGVELADELAHAFFLPAHKAVALANAVQVERFEIEHGFWIEPSMQQFFAKTHHLLGLTIHWNFVDLIINSLYGPGHAVFTTAFALWIFAFRRTLFSLLLPIFLVTNAMAVVLYEAYPLAPPRLEPSLEFDGHPFHFLDPVFGNGAGVKVGFNEYAAMPSIHIAWSLIVGITLLMVARPLAVRVLAVIYPAIMLMTVVVTGNHYLLDALGGAAVVALGLVATLAYARGRGTYPFERRMAIALPPRRAAAMRASSGAGVAGSGFPGRTQEEASEVGRPPTKAFQQ